MEDKDFGHGHRSETSPNERGETSPKSRGEVVAVLVYAVALALFSMFVVHLRLPDSLLYIFLIPCLLSAFFFRRRVYVLLLVTLAVAAIGVTSQISLDFQASLLTILFSAISMGLIAEVMHALVTARRRAEATLQMERNRAQRYLDITPAIIIILDTRGDIMLLNERGAEILECDQDWAIGQNWFTTFLPERVRDEVRIQTFARLTTGETESLEHVEGVVLTGAGTEKIIRWHNTLLKDEAGRVTGILSSGEDVTVRRRAQEARKRARLALRESEARLRQIIDLVPYPIFAKDAEGRFLLVNRAGAQFAGLTVEQMTGRLESEWITDPEVLRAIQADDRAVIAGGAPRFSPDDRFVDAHGQVRVMQTTKIPFVYHQGEPPGILGISVDITDLKRTEEALRRSRDDLARAQAVAHIGSYSWDLVHDVSTWSEELYRITGCEGQKPGFALMASLLHPDDRDHVLAAGRLAREKGEVFEVEYRIIRPDGEVRWLQDRAEMIIRDAEGVPQRMFGTVQDITARKEAEQELARYADALERSNEDLQQFAYTVSHDLKEPLRMVRSYLRLLRERYQGQFDTMADEFIAFAVDGAERMDKMIEDLLAYSRVQTRGPVIAPTDAAAVLARVLQGLYFEIEAAGARVTHDPLPTVLADETQLLQLFQNLIGNALKFHPKGQPPRVHIAVEQIHLPHEEDWSETGESGSSVWRFSVRDNGIGIAPQHYERIFGVFERLHTQEEYAGTGIGLAICKRIVERHGGRIWVESEVGEGTTFYFTLPGER
jgi:PAS domain S-box-containing protein